MSAGRLAAAGTQSSGIPVSSAIKPPSLVSAALVGVRIFGLSGAVNNSPAEVAVLCVPFLIAYALGYGAGAVIGLACIAVLVIVLEVASGAPISVISVMLIGGPWLAGQIVRSRRRLSENLRARNEELLAQQQAYAEEAVRYERSRIAADLHDVVGHALSLMVVQACAGQRAALAQGGSVDGGQASARAALEVVAEAAREAQAEVGLLAGLLADGQVVPGTPAGLDVVAELVRQMRETGFR